MASPDTRHNALREVLAAGSYTRNLTWWAHTPGTLAGAHLVAGVGGAVLPRLAVAVDPVRASTPFEHVARDRLRRRVRRAQCTANLSRRRSGCAVHRAPRRLLLGAALALVRRDVAGRWPRRWAGPVAERRASAAALIGTAGLIAIASWDAGDEAFGLGYTLAALASAILIYGLVVLNERGPCRVFAWRPAVALGRISYGFYLWHLPVLQWTDDRLIGRAGGPSYRSRIRSGTGRGCDVVSAARTAGAAIEE